MESDAQVQQRSLLLVVVAAAVALGLTRAAFRLGGLAVLAALVAGTVGVLAAGILVLRTIIGS